MKKPTQNPIISGLQDKEEKNTARALRTEAMKMALATVTENKDAVKDAHRIYQFIEYGVIQPTKEELKAAKSV